MLSLAAAASYKYDRRGGFFSLELQRQGNIFSFGLDKKIASTDFVRLGMIDGQSLPADQSRVYASTKGLGDAKIKSLDMDVYPYYRSGVMLKFPVTSTREAFFSLVWEDGSPLPVGAIVTNEKNEHFPVGMRGEVFLTDLEKVNHLSAAWKDQSCKFTLNVSESNTLISEPSEIVCYSHSF